MKEKWQQLLVRFDALSLRERLLVTIGVVALLFTSVDTLYLQPADEALRKAATSHKQLAQTLRQQQEQINLLRSKAPLDPDQANRSRKNLLQTELQRLSEDSQSHSRRYVNPKEVSGILAELLKDHPGLALEKVANLPAEAVLDKTDGKDQIQVYRHGLKLRLTGGYLETLDYLKAIETLPWAFYWDSLDYEVAEHPNASIELTLYAYSLGKEWIDV